MSAEVAWTSTTGATRDALFLAAGAGAFAAAASHAALERSLGWALGFLSGSFSVWFLADLLNRYTDLPFGHVRYTSHSGVALAGTPILLVLGWVALTYAALVAARRVAKATLLVAVLGAMYLAAADLVLQSALQRFGYLHWSNIGLTLPGAPGVPAQDLVGCLLVGVLVLLLLDLLPPNQARDGVPRVLFGWRYAGDVVGAAAVLQQPALAAVAALVGGALAVPYGYLLFVDRV